MLLARRIMSSAPNDSSFLDVSSRDASGLAPSKFFTLALVLIFIWGSAYTMVGVGVDYITPIWLVTYRLILGSILVTGYVFYKGHTLPKLSDVRWRWYLILGMIGSVIPFFLLSTGQLKVDSGITSIIVGVMPLMTCLLYTSPSPRDS